MILVDATGLVALLAGEPAAAAVEAILRSGEGAVVSVNLAETIDIMVRVRGVEHATLEDRLVPLLATSLPVVAVSEPEARRGAELRAAHYHHEKAPLSLADCLLIGAALTYDAEIATSDEPVRVVAETVGVPIRRLP